MSNFAVIRKMADPVVECKDPSMTSQADLKDTLISSIIRRYNATGVFPTNNRPVLIGNEFPADFTEGCNSFTEEKMKNEFRVAENSTGAESGSADGSVPVHSPSTGESGTTEESGSEEVK